MSFRPSTYFHSIGEWGADGTRQECPSDVECPECNRIGKWVSIDQDENRHLLIIPCYCCAKNNHFMWYGMPCNGSKEVHSIGFQELTNHEVAMRNIKDIYDKYKEEGIIIPQIDSMVCMDRILNDVISRSITTEGPVNDVWTDDPICRGDLYDYYISIKTKWDSLGSFPIGHQGDIEHEIKFFQETFYDPLEEYEPYMIDYQGSHVVFDFIEDDEWGDEESDEENNEENDEENVDYKQLCHNGGDILDKVMEEGGSLNEENYKQLMDIFQKIYNS